MAYIINIPVLILFLLPFSLVMLLNNLLLKLILFINKLGITIKHQVLALNVLLLIHAHIVWVYLATLLLNWGLCIVI